MTAYPRRASLSDRAGAFSSPGRPVSYTHLDVYKRQIVGDGSYQMLPMEIATIVSEGLKVIIVLLDNGGFASIGALSQSRGSQRFGTSYRMRSHAGGRLDGAEVPFDLAANAASWGANVLRCTGIEQFRVNYARAVASDRTTVLYIATDLVGPNPPGTAWWDVPVAVSYTHLDVYKRQSSARTRSSTTSSATSSSRPPDLEGHHRHERDDPAHRGACLLYTSRCV